MLALLCAAWVAALAIGGTAAWRYMTTAGETHDTPLAWPSDTEVPRRIGEATVIMFVSPDCPCSRASLRELASLGGHPIVVATGTVPSDASPAFAWLPDDGAEAKRFGAATSGYVVAYDASGKLQFSGGITPARGHEGPNIGRDQLAAVIAGKPLGDTHAVFGCAL